MTRSRPRHRVKRGISYSLSMATPTTKAKTVYGLLSAIARLTAEDPKRMRMETWLDEKAGEYPDAYDRRVPACGTVGCIGGWMQALARVHPGAFLGRPARFGLTAAMADELFYGPLEDDPWQGTRSHASKVITHIRRFQKRYAKVLRATKVPRNKAKA